jgi:acyl-CoA synthetase (AMP-forming)/AMP-acid ligase II
MRTLNRPKPIVAVERRADGVVILSAGRALESEASFVIDHLQRAALRRPDVTFLAQRRGSFLADGRRAWQRLTYAEAWARTGAVASWLIAQGFGPATRPVAILSDNSLENALFLFGALRAGALVAPIPPDYSLSGDFARLDQALSVVEPALVFAQDSQAYGGALDRVEARGARIVTVDGGRGLAFAALANCSIDAAVSERRGDITADTPAKILLTSGSTGLPRGVVNTHGNLAAAAEMVRSIGEPLDENRIAVSLDWLPWHHTAGGNASLNDIVRSAGSLHIDDEETPENLRELAALEESTASGWGMAETTSVGLPGLPLPGALVKLVPAGDRYEVRVKGPHVMAGYHKQPDATREAFDEEGFFRTGDAARWVNEADPLAGIEFAGRLAEPFKLDSGRLRTALIDALQPHVRDLVIAAPDRPWLGALVWLDPAAGGPEVWRPELARLLAAFNARPGGSSTRVRRLMVVDEPPSPAAGEITDKRSLDTRRVLERLYAEPPGPDVIVAGG